MNAETAANIRQRFSQWTIRKQLTLIIMTISILVLFLACTAFVVFQVLHLRRAMVRDSQTQAAILGNGVTYSLEFDDPADAEKVLSRLREKPSVAYAATYDSDGVFFAEYKRERLPQQFAPPPFQPEGHRFGEGMLTLYQPIYFNQELLGFICIQSDLKEMTSLLMRNGAAALLVMILSSLLAFALSAKLQRVITDPLMALAHATNVISQKKDYSQLEIAPTNVEMGALIYGFNDMLAQIEFRDTELVKAKERAEEYSRELAMHRDRLEDLVQERTEALTQTNERLQREIAERKLTEEMLAKSRERLRSLWENVPDNIAELDPRGVVQIANRALPGVETDEIVGANLFELFPENLKAALRQALDQAASTHKTATFDVPFNSDDGLTWWSHRIVPIIRDGRAVNFLTIISDITERKRAHRDIALANKELQYEVNQRMQTEAQLQVLLANLERANRELEDFAYIVSHDLKAPLRGMSSLASWLAEDYGDVLDEDGRDYLNDLVNQARWMHHLIEGILEYSRLGRAKAKLEPLFAEAVAKEAVDLLAPPPQISVVIESPLPTVVYDRIHLKQLFQNLIENAIKYLGKPTGEIVIACRNAPAHWEFCVRDNGVGIEEKHFDRIFKMFQTLKPREETPGSTGIGLALVKKIVERHGGSVRVTSKFGEGAAFYFTILKSLKPDREDCGETLLLIDHHSDFAGVAAKMLKHAGFDTMHLTSAHEACKLLGYYKGVIHTALMDADPADMDAVALYGAMRRLRPMMQIIACAGKGAEQAVERLRKEGVDGVLRKPFSIEELNRIIKGAGEPG